MVQRHGRPNLEAYPRIHSHWPCPGIHRSSGTAPDARLTISLSEAYEPRTIRFLELWEQRGWQLKIYGIAYRKPSPDKGLILAAKNIARTLLSNTASQHTHYGVGFMGIHEGRGAKFAFVDWWADQNQLHHHVFVSSSNDPL
jgi:hypothetical protein